MNHYIVETLCFEEWLQVSLEQTLADALNLASALCQEPLRHFTRLTDHMVRIVTPEGEIL